MANITVENDKLVINIEGLDKLWTFTGRLEIPLAHITDAKQDPDVVYGWKGWRGPLCSFKMHLHPRRAYRFSA